MHISSGLANKLLKLSIYSVACKIFAQRFLYGIYIWKSLKQTDKKYQYNKALQPKSGLQLSSPLTCYSQFHHHSYSPRNERVITFSWKLFYYLPPSGFVCLFLFPALSFSSSSWSSCVSPPPLPVFACCSGEPVRGSEEHRPSGHHQHAWGPARGTSATSQTGIAWAQ